MLLACVARAASSCCLLVLLARVAAEVDAGRLTGGTYADFGGPLTDEYEGVNNGDGYRL